MGLINFTGNSRLEQLVISKIPTKPVQPPIGARPTALNRKRMQASNGWIPDLDVS
jgi:hypothetical protein